MIKNNNINEKNIVKAPNEIGVLFFGFFHKIREFLLQILLDFWVHRCYYLCVHEREVILWYEWVDRLITQKTIL